MITKGEWKAIKPNYPTMHSYHVNAGDSRVADVFCGADAQLIAKSPRMYETLKQIAVLLANPLTTRDEMPKRMRIHRAADEAWQLALQILKELDNHCPL